jgi:uncharacterized membrane protein YraQ (UPF0718 family)
MEQKRRKQNMLVPTLILGTIATVLLAIGYFRGSGEHVAGVKSGLVMMVEIIPLLIFAFIVAGMVQELLPHEVVSKWLGDESGWRGIMIGTVAGGLSPGGPFVSMPLAAGLYRAGGGVGTIVAYLTAWSLWAIMRLPMEVGILGWRLTFIRLASTFFFPPIAGFVAHVLFSGTR